MKLVIVGGVAGGASAAARARRLSETAEIIVSNVDRMSPLPTVDFRTTSAGRLLRATSCL